MHTSAVTTIVCVNTCVWFVHVSEKLNVCENIRLQDIAIKVFIYEKFKKFTTFPSRTQLYRIPMRFMTLD